MTSLFDPEYQLPSSLGTTTADTTGDNATKPDDPLAAWRTFWDAAGRGVPHHVNRTVRLRRGIRQLGRK